MHLSKYISEIILFLTLTILLSSCFDNPDEFVAPIWDAEVNIPVTKKEFSLLEIVEKDSSMLKSSLHPETLGLIYFGDTQAVSTIKIEDELRLNQFETRFSQSIGRINISVPIPAASEIKVEDWTTEVTTGTTQVFPEQEGNVIIDISGVETVESILIEEGKLSVLLLNNLPVEIVLRGVKIQNAIDESVIVERPGSNPADWITIPAFEFDTLTFPINEKIITNALQYVGTIYSEGSSGENVVIAEQAGTTVLALFEDLVIGAATAAIPEQYFQFENSLVLDDSTKIERALIGEGNARLYVNNNMDLNLTTSITFKNLFDELDEPYKLSISLSRNEQDRIIDIPNLINWSIATENPGVPTGEISYAIQITTDSTGEISTVTKSDSVSFQLVFGELIFESFEGLLKPTVIEFTDNGFKLDYGDFDNQLEFGEVNFNDAKFNLNLNSSADLNILMEGELSATNGLIQANKVLENIIIPSQDPVEIDITPLINEFSSELPDSFSMAGSAMLNPYYQVSKVSRGDSVYGSIDFEVPLNVGIAQGSFTDTFEVDLGDVDRDDIDRLNYGEVTFSIRNSVPVGLTFNAVVLDSNYAPMLTIPTANNSISSIEVPKPDVSESGDILLAGDIVQTISLYGEEIKIFLDNPYMMIHVNFSTAGIGNAPVKFKTSNKISFDVRAKAEYRVDF